MFKIDTLAAESSRPVPLLPVKKLLAAALTSRAIGRFIGGLYANKIPHRGTTIEIPPDTAPYITACLFWRLYESAEIRCLNRFLTDKVDVIEFGSNVGGVACQVARRLAGRRKMVCIEANPELIPFLRRNLARNAPAQPVVIINAALGHGVDGKVSFAISANNLTSRIGSERNLLEVRAITLSEVLREQGIADFALLCDVEGAEVGLFTKEPGAFARCRLLIIETHEVVLDGIDYSIDEIIRLIQRSTSMTLAHRYGPVCAFTRTC